MAQKYAKDMPAGFTNRIERVAIVGAGGRVGGHIARALLATNKFTVTAITRHDSTNKIPEGAKAAKVDYADESSLVDALKGQQFLVISMNVMADPSSQPKLLAAATKAGVPWVMPNCYGTDLTNKSLGQENMTGKGTWDAVEQIEKEGVSSWIAMCCSFWYEYSLGSGLSWFGFDIPNKKVVFYDDGKTRINTSTNNQCGHAMAALLSLKELPEDENDKSPTVSNWRNKPLYISSFLACQRDMLDSIHRVTGSTDADWSIEYEPTAERYVRGMELIKAGGPNARQGFGISMYSRTFYPNGDGNFGAKHGLANDILNLPKENIDDATKTAVDLSLKGEIYT